MRLRAAAILAACVLGSGLLGAQDWQTATTLNGLDFTGLTEAQKATALKLIRARDCSCGCAMKVAECRVKDPACTYSRGLATTIIKALREGKTAQQATAAADASRFNHVPGRNILDDAVTIPTKGAPVTGAQNARVTLVEFSDFQCPYCAQAFQNLKAVLQAYPNEVRLVFKQFPLDTHSQAQGAAIAALAANKQGKFWELHDRMFMNRTNLSRPAIVGLAGGLGMDMKQFQADLDSPDLAKAVQKDLNDGLEAGVMGTPTLFIDGQKYNGMITLQNLKPILDAELKKASGKPTTTASR